MPVIELQKSKIKYQKSRESCCDTWIIFRMKLGCLPFGDTIVKITENGILFQHLASREIDSVNPYYQKTQIFLVILVVI